MIIRLAFSVFEGSLGSQYIDGKHLFSSIKEIPKCLRIVIHWLLINFSLLLIIASFICFQVVSYVLLTLFRMSFFGAAHGWGGGGGRKKTPPQKSVKHILQCSNLAQLYLTQRRFKKYMNHATHPLSSADIHIFSPEISKFCCIKKYGYRLHFDTQFLSILTFLESL